LQEVPLVSGACVALRAHDLKDVGGWSTDYLIGDFEDSDLCLRLIEKGLKVGYLPSTPLTHLERQSMASIGDNTFRERITLLNATLYNKRWHKELQGMSK
jgi:GT2 family glycosyltransferase